MRNLTITLSSKRRAIYELNIKNAASLCTFLIFHLNILQNQLSYTLLANRFLIKCF